MIKKLNIRSDKRRVKTIEEIENFCTINEIPIPNSIKEFLLEYEGCGIADENSYYYDSDGNCHEINQILYLKESDEGGASIQAIYKGHLFYNNKGFIPFAIDSGGWDYNVSISEETYGQVWVDKFDSGEENPMHYVADSFEKFINNLEDERVDE
jgi:hypothetical protein